MKNAFRIVGLIAATTLLASCGLFGDKEEELKPMELVRIDQTLKIRKVWSANLGGDAESARGRAITALGEAHALG